MNAPCRREHVGDVSLKGFPLDGCGAWQNIPTVSKPQCRVLRALTRENFQLLRHVGAPNRFLCSFCSWDAVRKKTFNRIFPLCFKELPFYEYPSTWCLRHTQAAVRHAVHSICINNYVSKSRLDKNLDRSEEVWRGHGKFKPRKPDLSMALPRFETVNTEQQF